MMLWTPVDLIFAMASSDTALKAERDALVSTLTALRAGLASGATASTGGVAEEAQFSNAASDFLCQARLLTAGPNRAYAELDELAMQVERVLVMLQHDQVQPGAAGRLLESLTTEIERLQRPEG